MRVLLLFYLRLFSGVGDMYATQHLPKSEDSWQELAFSFYHVGSGLKLRPSGEATSAFALWVIVMLAQDLAFKL